MSKRFCIFAKIIIMTILEITLLVILYLFLAAIVYRKQRDVNDSESNQEAANWLAVIAPVTVLIYAIRAVFFENWK
jgi:heme/copper-type cytochrome/quinol oxidase subunit 2